MVTTLSSNGWRSTSRTFCPNSGSSSRKRTPRWERLISPGRGNRPPPTRPAWLIVMRRAKGTLQDQRHIGGQHTADTVNLGHFERLFDDHTRQNRGRGTGEQGLAGAGRAAHQNIMTPAGRDLQRAFDMLLPAYRRHILPVDDILFEIKHAWVGDERLYQPLPVEMGHKLVQRLDGIDDDLLDQRGLDGIDGRHENGFDAFLTRQGDHWQDAVGMAQAAIERKLAQKQVIRYLLIRVDGARSQQYSYGYRKIVGRAFLPQVGGRQIDGDALIGKKAATVLYRRTHPFPRFVDGSIGETDNREGSKPVGDIHLNLDQRAFQTNNCTTLYLCQHK